MTKRLMRKEKKMREMREALLSSEMPTYSELEEEVELLRLRCSEQGEKIRRQAEHITKLEASRRGHRKEMENVKDNLRQINEQLCPTCGKKFSRSIGLGLHWHHAKRNPAVCSKENRDET